VLFSRFGYNEINIHTHTHIYRWWEQKWWL